MKNARSVKDICQNFVKINILSGKEIFLKFLQQNYF